MFLLGFIAGAATLFAYQVYRQMKKGKSLPDAIKAASKPSPDGGGGPGEPPSGP